MSQPGYNIYCGHGGVDAVDWSRLAAFVADGQTTAAITLPMAEGELRCLAARAVDGNGQEDSAIAAVCFAQLDAQGKLCLNPLAPVAQLSGELLTNGLVSLSFSCHRREGLAEAEQFEILSDRGTGLIDTAKPVTSVSRSPAGRYILRLIPPALPAKFAVRPRSGDDIGLPCQAVSITAADAAPPVVLQ